MSEETKPLEMCQHFQPNRGNEVPVGFCWKYRKEVCFRGQSCPSGCPEFAAGYLIPAKIDVGEKTYGVQDVYDAELEFDMEHPPSRFGERKFWDDFLTRSEGWWRRNPRGSFDEQKRGRSRIDRMFLDQPAENLPDCGQPVANAGELIGDYLQRVYLSLPKAGPKAVIEVKTKIRRAVMQCVAAQGLAFSESGVFARIERWKPKIQADGQ